MALKPHGVIPEIPIAHIGEDQKDCYYSRLDFFTHYEKMYPGEIGVVFDRRTAKPIMRVICDRHAGSHPIRS